MISLLSILVLTGFCTAWLEERPVLQSRDGNLIISGAKDRNITFKTLGNGFVNIGDVNLLHIAMAAKNATRLIDRWRTGYFSEVETNLQRLSEIVEGPMGLERRIRMLEWMGDSNSSTAVTSRPRGGRGSTDLVARTGLRRLNTVVTRLEEKVNGILDKLRENDCQSNPCLNGGTCQDIYEGFICHCSSNWEGSTCASDVNECAKFFGTDLGCQNGATCVNLPGSYQCNCAPGFFGLHCTKKTSACNEQTSSELCGHGVCVSKPGTPLGYTCICDQGWQADGIANPACTKDVDECAANHPPCSVNPPVPCQNTPGGFSCGSCPHGYTGNGYYCADIDECLTDNGGCSQTPFVQCINTMGSRVCGQCPSGYQGDGTRCAYAGACRINNGGCHPLATCIENAGLAGYVQCRCPAGYEGSGMGPNGCQPGAASAGCESNPCLHGTCIPNQGYGFTCRCNVGFAGTLCNIAVNPCSPNPCKNNGACIANNGGYTCDCNSAFTGERCETPRQTCGGVSRSLAGHLDFPSSGTTYQHGLSCAWVVITNHSLVLNVTFHSFTVEQSTDCKFDFLQIHDGRNAGSQVIGRFCGNQLPNGGNIISSHNSLYFWFYSDSSISHEGFSMQWNSVMPVCGGEFTNNYGTITSPGSPGRYPPNRDCNWYVILKPGSRIQFHFGQIMLEEHPTCEFDYLEILDDKDNRIAVYCNHTHPEPLITPTHYAMVHFHSDSAGQDAGFQIHYTKVEGIPGCGGVYTSVSGVISTPSHSTMLYGPNMECEWKIQLPQNDRIKITWISFELEASHYCRFDYVEVRDGGSVDSPLIGRYCGSDLPPPIKSTSNVLLITFTSDWNYELEGFKLQYDTLCGGVFTESTGIVTSPLYPQSYPASRVCTYEIVAPTGKGIILTLEDMDIEGYEMPDCYFDKLEVFDGDNENSTLLATICGSSDETPTTPFLSTHNYLFLKFTTDSSIHNRGFKANYTTVDRRCGGILKEASGVIESPSSDGKYSNNEECTWTIKAPSGYIISLSWISFNLESHYNCRNDYVKIYENYTAEETDLMGTYCGATPPPTLLTQGNLMTIVFKTDSSVSLEGFVASYIFMDASKMCGGHYFKQNGVITSPNYPKDYPRSKECVWVIEAPNKRRIVLKVDNFTLEYHHQCSFDFLELRNGGYETSPFIGKYCGEEIPTYTISQTNQLYIRFVSDNSRSEKGFSLSWDSTTDGCGGVLNGVSGDITSPNYPQPYSHSAECTWKIIVATGNLIQIFIMDLDLERHARCRYDYIEISDGPTRRKNAPRYCGTNHPALITTSGNMATIRFRSDFTTSGRGFRLKYETLCQNKVRGFQGVIESPNFPNKYQHNANCSWIIEAPIGNKINLTFSHFDLEGRTSDSSCSFDRLLIAEGEQDQPYKELGVFCDSNSLPENIQSSQHQVFVKFTTDSFLAFGGFRLEWLVDGCVEHLTKPEDSFTSPGYPGSYESNIQCEWLIEVDLMHSIEITFEDIDTEKNKECKFDKIQVFSGANDQAPKILEICKSDKPVVYTSFGNKMFVKFYSDSSYSGRGFKAKYRSVPTKCGGKFTANKGVIHSASYPQNYAANENCEWLIEVDKYHVVYLTFNDFDLEDSRNCSDDSVKVFDGPTRDDYLLGTHCGNHMPPPYLSTSNQMLVVMRTDNIISAKGFSASFVRECGARIIVKDSGYISTSFMDYNSHHETNCTWIFVAEDPSDHVTLTFTHMDLLEFSAYEVFPNISECPYQRIEVFEGEGVDGPSLGKWCSSKVPPPIISTGNALTLHLFAMYDFGNNLITATYSSLSSACGGNYTSEHGILTSPGYPSGYMPNSECIWILNTSPGNQISVSFEDFDIESSENCDLDYLEIRENNGAGKLLGTFCGKDGETITSNQKLWMKFKTDGAGTAKGFKLDYSFLHGNELEGPLGEICSPLYPIPYGKESTVTWRITVQFGMIIRIEFKDFRVGIYGKTCYSSLKIFDGYNDEANLIIEACGLTKPEPVQTTSNVAYIKLSSMGILQTALFDLVWLEIPKSESGTSSTTEISECNEEIALMDNRNQTYSFSSPGWPEGYKTNLICNWLFTSPPGTHIKFRLIQINLEETSDCLSDSVSVYSGNALLSLENAKLLQRMCLANSTMTLVKGTNIMTVRFETDSYYNKTGFRAYVYRDCGGQFEGPNGVIEINNDTMFRGMRPWVFSCEWTVKVKAGKTIEVKIDEWNSAEQDTSTCSNNYILLKNGGEASSPILGSGKYCSTTEESQKLNTTGNLLYVKFSGTRPMHFRLTYRQLNMQCGGSYVMSETMQQFELSSPNYPNIPPSNSECFWSIRAPPGELLSIHFDQRFDLSHSYNCESEFVEIRDGGTSSSKMMGRFCADVAPSSMATTGNTIYIHYFTNLPAPNNGFMAIVTSSNVCGGILRNKKGVINSPNYPESYASDAGELECGWLIEAPVGHTLKFEFRDIHLPSYRKCEVTDHVKIGEKDPANKTITDLGSYCGSSKPDVIETSSNEAFVMFKTSKDHSRNHYRGFSLNYTASKEVCGGQLTAMSGIIKSPGYPNPRVRGRYCDWKITLPLGFQVVVDILDLDLIDQIPGRFGYTLSFYNDFQYKSKIKAITQNYEMQQISSSSNQMMIITWSNIGHRGFKLRYTGVAPAPCGGSLNEIEGTLSPPANLPFNETSYFCIWNLKPPEYLISSGNETGLTLSVKINGSVGSQKATSYCYSSQSYVSVKGVKKICGNLTEPAYIRSPLQVNEISIMNGTYGDSLLRFNMEYKWQSCGGILEGTTHKISTPKNIPFPINCAWNIKYPDVGETLRLEVLRFNLGSCDNSYITIRNGGPMSPVSSRICGTLSSSYNFTSTSNQLWIEYFAAAAPNDFELSIQSTNAGCGGTLGGISKQIASPQFPKQYPPNAECVWEIIADNGFHIGLVFVDRFNLESNCDKDYVEIFDWKTNSSREGNWTSLGKVCGRNTPAPFNSTSNRMKVVFRSNEAVQGDGFRAIWEENCGGIFQVTTAANTLVSPQFPDYYRPNLVCNYTLVAPDQDIIVDFTDFYLELGRSDCRFDNVTIKTIGTYMEVSEATYCGRKKPPIQRSYNRMEIIFKTDHYIEQSGFRLKYYINDCGGIITKPTKISPLMSGSEYFGNMNCTWIIKAPKDDTIILRFEKFVTEYSSECYFDSVIVYEGEFIDYDKSLGKICGNLTSQLPVFKSVGNKMTVYFNTDNSRNRDGFTAEVLFGKSVAAGCGGIINVTVDTTYAFKSQKGEYYESLQDCHWNVITTPGHNIKFTISSIELKNAFNTTDETNNCTGDYLLVHDGPGPFSEILGKYCGTVVPVAPIISSSNELWIRLFTDGTVEGRGVSGSIKAVNNLCGIKTLRINETKLTLTSPNYPNSYGPGTSCRWQIVNNYEYTADRLYLRFLDFEMADSKNCEEEYLQITDNSYRHYIDEGFGTNLIYSGTQRHPVSVETGSYMATSSYKYCGSQLPHDFYSYSSKIDIKFVTSSTGHKGFKLEYGAAKCDRNYTSEQGRIFHQGFSECWITITAPVNHTISLYFNNFELYDNDECTNTGMQVWDGNSSSGKLLALICGVQLPSPVFSTSNKLTLHSWSQSSYSYENYDLIYTTTDKGRGCGGRIFNYGGRFTSPMYPNVYRNNTICTWNIIVPRGFDIILKFTVFDLGNTNCANDYLKIYDVISNQEPLLRTTFCAGDNPEQININTNEILVTYKSTVNNGGTGWVVSFMAQHKENPIEIYN